MTPPIKILVVEDEPIIAMDICDQLEQLGYFVFDPVTNYSDAIASIETKQPDFAILDIQLDGTKTGIDVGGYINQNVGIPFIYLTSNSDKRTLGQAKHTLPYAYLVKPFTEDDLFTSIELAISNHAKQSSEQSSVLGPPVLKKSLFVKNKHLYHKVNYEDIVYIKSDHVYIELYTNNGEKHLIRESLSNFLERLPNDFYRTHRSYVVNLNYLEAINSVEVQLSRASVPISKTYRDNLLNMINLE